MTRINTTVSCRIFFEVESSRRIISWPSSVNKSYSERNEYLSADIHILSGGPRRNFHQLGDISSGYGVIKFGLNEMKAKSLASLLVGRVNHPVTKKRDERVTNNNAC